MAMQAISSDAMKSKSIRCLKTSANALDKIIKDEENAIVPDQDMITKLKNTKNQIQTTTTKAEKLYNQVKAKDPSLLTHSKDDYSLNNLIDLAKKASKGDKDELSAINAEYEQADLSTEEIQDRTARDWLKQLAHGTCFKGLKVSSLLLGVGATSIALGAMGTSILGILGSVATFAFTASPVGAILAVAGLALKLGPKIAATLNKYAHGRENLENLENLIQLGDSTVYPGGNPPVSNGPVSNGPVSNGPVSNGPVSNGPVSNGPVSNGPVSNGPVSNGPVSNGPVSNGPVSNGPVSNGPVSNGPVSNGPVSNGPVSNGPVSNGPVSNGPVSNGPVSNGPVSNGPVSNGPVSNGPVSNGPVSNGPVSNGPVSNGPVSNGPVSSRPPRPPRMHKMETFLKELFGKKSKRGLESLIARLESGQYLVPEKDKELAIKLAKEHLAEMELAKQEANDHTRDSYNRERGDEE